MTTYLCPICGAQIPPGNTFCTGCGTPLTVQKQTPAVWRVLRCIFSVILMPILVLALIGTVSLYAVQHAISTDTFQTVIESVDILEMEVTTEELGVATVEDVLYDTYSSACVEAGMDVPLTREQMGEVLDRSTVDEFLADKMSAIADDLLNNTGTGSITTEEILSLMKENEALIAEVTGGFVMTDEQYDAVAAAVEESGVTETLNVSELRDEMDLPGEVLPLFSSSLLWVAIGGCLFLFAALALLNLRSRFLGFLYSGIGCLIAGAICSLTLAAQSLITGMMHAEGDLPLDMVTPIISKLLSGFWGPGLCLVGAGILLLVAFTVLRIVRRKKA